jgi:hypothetical protein
VDSPWQEISLSLPAKPSGDPPRRSRPPRPALQSNREHSLIWNGQTHSSQRTADRGTRAGACGRGSWGGHEPAEEGGAGFASLADWLLVRRIRRRLELGGALLVAAIPERRRRPPAVRFRKGERRGATGRRRAAGGVFARREAGRARLNGVGGTRLACNLGRPQGALWGWTTRQAVSLSLGLENTRPSRYAGPLGVFRFSIFFILRSEIYVTCQFQFPQALPYGYGWIIRWSCSCFICVVNNHVYRRSTIV